MTNCLARPDRFKVMRCPACRVSWDSDDVAACPRQDPTIVPDPAVIREPFVSGLAPDHFAHSASTSR